MLRTTITTLLLALAACLSAQDNLKMHLDFENVSAETLPTRFRESRFRHPALRRWFKSANTTLSTSATTVAI